MVLSLQFRGMAEHVFLCLSNFVSKFSWIELFPFVSFRPDFAACKANGAVSILAAPYQQPSVTRDSA